MSCDVYSGILTATHGLTVLDNLQTVGYQEDVTFAKARGDNMIFNCNIGVNLNDVTGEITTKNMALSETMVSGKDDDLGFTVVKKAGTGNNGVITLVNAVLGSISRSVNHGSDSELTIPFECYSVDGATSPITEDYTP